MDESSTWVTSKLELLERIDSAWNDLQAAIDGLTPDQLTGPEDAGGWTAKDHLAHLAAWENSMVFLLQGQPRHEGLGVSEPTYLAGEEDAINDEIFRKTRDLDLAGTLALHAMVHSNMLALLAHLTDSDFRPVPSVDSVLLRISRRETPLIDRDEQSRFEDFLTALFTAWKPTVREALATVLPKRIVTDLDGAFGSALLDKPGDTTPIV